MSHNPQILDKPFLDKLKEKFEDKEDVNFKYNEKEIMEELYRYITNTYNGHYIGENNIQSLDLIFAKGHGLGFCIGNDLKYASRFPDKKGEERKDLFKILHYTILLIYLWDKEQKNNNE